jgi:hypothetical protein
MESERNLEELDPKDIKFGLIAIDPEQEREMKDVLHFCGYWNQPTLVDVESLRKELSEDTKFGLTDIAHRLEIIPAPDYIVQEFANQIREDYE